MGRELEYKYKISDQARFDGLREALLARYPGGWEQVKMETDYYDTPDFRLAARRWTLRIRCENGVGVLTVKTPGQGRTRGEWAVPEGTLPGGLMALVRRGAPEELMELYDCRLRRVCGARFRRLRRLVEIPGATVELALDRGVLLGGSKELPFWELEAELKDGEGQALANWCEALASEFSLPEECRSKFVRASALAGGSRG